jgi:tripartite-type tricarboxylate transporter receptor subunit TctC
MTISRRELLRLATAAATLPVIPTVAGAQNYPSRPVRLVVGFAAGGTNDILARHIAQMLARRLAQPFVVENRPGASSNIATEAVVRAPPDGYTLLLVGPSNLINTTLCSELKFDFARDIIPVAGVSREPYVMAVNPDFPARTVGEFITFAKANPGKINMASAGAGSITHVVGELFRMMAGIEMTHVAYRGGAPALTDLLAGRVQVFFVGAPAVLEHVRSGKLRALGVTTKLRSPALPDVPALAEAVPGYEASAWYGIGAPKGTPADVIETLNQTVNAGLAESDFQQRLTNLGGTALPTSPAELGTLVGEDTEKWRKVIKFAHIEPS